MIIGAGISGLTAACCCQSAGLDVIVVEAADRIGGRVHSVYSGADYCADLGPTWVWPMWQAPAKRWLEKLGITCVPQFNDGDGIVERGDSATRYPLPAQQGISRLTGGPQAIVQRLYGELSERSVLFGEPVTQVVQGESSLQVHTAAGATGLELSAPHVICCAPLRVVAEAVAFEPALSSELLSLLQRTPTWMAAQAKAAIRYPAPFWRESGLSGRIASSVGPLVEVHDHSGSSGHPAALIGFVGVPVASRSGQSSMLRAAIVAQLVRCFGDSAAAPSGVHIEDWADNTNICSASDRLGPAVHPEPLPELIRQPAMAGRLNFAVSETAAGSPGLIDGAFEAGETSALRVINTMQRDSAG